jgi:spermidine synthase
VSRSRTLALLLVLFFFSGACGLTYQVLWLRLLALVFGVTVYAASTVLAAFMTGLACGSLLAGVLLKRFQRPLTVFGAAEILIGISALATPVGLDLAEALYRMLYGSGLQSFGLLTIARLVCSFTVLLIPTVLMGVTLPVLSAAPAVREQLGARVGALYACNTAGALIGAVLTGFELIGSIGIQNTFFLAAAINLAVGAIAVWADRAKPAARTVAGTDVDEEPRFAGAQTPDPIFVAVIALSGLAALALEIVWFRMLVQYLDATTYAFTTMLATVLGGIAVGGAIAARMLRIERDRTITLVTLQLATGIAVLASAVFLAWSYNAGWKTAAPIQACVAAIFPAAVLMGVSFPIALRAGVPPKLASNSARAEADAGAGAARTARSVGLLYAANVGGAIAGALIGGFVLLPQLGTRVALIASAGIYVVTAALLVVRVPKRAPVFARAVVGTLVFAVLAIRTPDPFVAAFARRHGTDMREFWRDEGVQTAVSVHASQFRRSLYLDGLHQANDTPDMVRLHRVIGHLPMALHPKPTDALVVGLGGGATAGAVSQHGGVRVQIVELSDGVRRAAAFFPHISYDVLQQPNVRLRVDDGRNFLLLSGERFDVITADIIQPGHAGAGNLYSREYFTLVRNALKEGGLALQWIGHRPETQYKLIMRTFLSAFPNTTLWFDGGLMVGSVQPLTVHAQAFAAKRANPQTAAALDEVGLHDFETLKSWYTAGPGELRRFVGDGTLLTDNQPLVEYGRTMPRNDPMVNVSLLGGDVSQVVRE